MLIARIICFSFKCNVHLKTYSTEPYNSNGDATKVIKLNLDHFLLKYDNLMQMLISLYLHLIAIYSR